MNPNSKLPRPAKLAVLVCELKDGNYWPLLRVHQGPQGCVIESGGAQAARALEVLPAAVEAVETELARREAKIALLTKTFREQLEIAVASLLPAPEAGTTNQP